jgi:hypothetical protein
MLFESGGVGRLVEKDDKFDHSKFLPIGALQTHYIIPEEV